MRALFIVLFVLLAIPGLSLVAKAEDGVPQALGAEQAPQDPADLDARLELARKMHEINPTRPQIDAAIEDVASRQPPNEQEAFRTAMRGALNYQAIEKISIDAMAETYTKPELEAMVEYFGKPEAKSAALKDTIYNKKVYPEIARMLDQSIMRVRTGGAP